MDGAPDVHPGLLYLRNVSCAVLASLLRNIAVHNAFINRKRDTDMRSRFWSMGGLVAVLATTPAFAEVYDANQGPREVAILKDDWHDAARQRDIPVLICYPKDLGKGSEKLPVIIFSHGLGGTREGYAPYGEHWASYGYVVIFPQHHGSDSGVIGHGLYKMLMGQGDLQPFLDRVQDIHFVLDQVEAIDAGRFHGQQYAVFKNTLDLAHIGMSGHSFGALTTQAIAGQKYPVAADAKFTDPRIKAAIAMSGAGSQFGDQDRAFGSIHIPVFYLTGTRDSIGTKTAADRRVPFDHSAFSDTFLVTFNGADHMSFFPREGILGSKTNYQSWIRQSTTAFWDAYLKNSQAAKEWFENEFPHRLGTADKFERK